MGRGRGGWRKATAQDGCTHPQAQPLDHLLRIALQDHPAEQRGAVPIPPGSSRHGSFPIPAAPHRASPPPPRASVSLPVQSPGMP